jgi:hypothetical protein
VAIVVGAVAWAGCSSAVPALRDRTNALLADYLGRTPAAVAAPTSPGPRPWEVGQYVVFAVRRDGDVGLLRYAIEERTREGVWLEIQELSFSTQTSWRVLLEREPVQAGELVTLVRRAVVSPQGEPARVYDFEMESDAVLAHIREMLKPRWAGFLPTPALAGERTSATTAAGRFEDTAPTRVRLLVLGEVNDFAGRRSDAVPLSGLVVAQTTDRRATIELVEFGDDGAASLF